MNGRKSQIVGIVPLVKMVTVRADIVIAAAAPGRWAMLNKGIPKLTDSFLMKGTLCAHSRATGKVAALDMVPIAVKYAGNMVFSTKNEFFLV
jgi:hypothetical protein